VLLLNLNPRQQTLVQLLCQALGTSVCIQLYSRDVVSSQRVEERLSRFAIVLPGRLQIFIFRWDYSKVLHSVPVDQADLNRLWFIRGVELPFDHLRYPELTRQWESGLRFRGIPISSDTTTSVYPDVAASNPA
jgi:hypothetical protein